MTGNAAKAAELLRRTAEHVLQHPDDQEQWWISEYGEAHGYESPVIRAAISAREHVSQRCWGNAAQYAAVLRLAALKVSGGAL